MHKIERYCKPKETRELNDITLTMSMYDWRSASERFACDMDFNGVSMNHSRLRQKSRVL